MNMRRRYSQEVRERAVNLVAEIQKDHESQWSAIESVSQKLGCLMLLRIVTYSNNLNGAPDGPFLAGFCGRMGSLPRMLDTLPFRAFEQRPSRVVGR